MLFLIIISSLKLLHAIKILSILADRLQTNYFAVAHDVGYV